MSRFTQSARRLHLEALEDRTLLATFLVRNTQDGTGLGTLRWAINESNNTPAADRILFHESTTSKTLILTIGQLPAITGAVQIIGGGVTGNSISGNNIFRVFEVATTGKAHLELLNILDGAATNGAGVYSSGKLILTKCKIVNNHAENRGGGIYHTGRELGIYYSAVQKNSADVGGGMWSFSSHLSVSHSTYTRNRGGGAYAGGGKVEIAHTIVSANHDGGIALVLANGTILNSVISRNNGGPLFLDQGTYSIENTEITENYSTFAGAAAVTVGDNGIATLKGSNVSQNTNVRGIGNYGNLSLVECLISENESYNGGAGILNLGTLAVHRSTIADNVQTAPDSSGGGIYNNGDARVIDSVISSNLAKGHNGGGGIYNIFGNLTVIGTTVTGNATTGSSGGGIYHTGGGKVRLINSTISANSASANMFEGNGGGVWLYLFEPGSEIVSTTITANHAQGAPGNGFGGGLYVHTAGKVPLLSNTLIAQNRTVRGGADVWGPVASNGHKLIGISDGSSGWSFNDLLGTANAPVDPVLGPLAPNGGPTPTIALLPGSPAINAGDNAYAPVWDQRGVGYPRIVNGTIDIGAFEVQTTRSSETSGRVAVLVTADLEDPLLVAEIRTTPVVRPPLLLPNPPSDA